jgi:hypothetical protein
VKGHFSFHCYQPTLSNSGLMETLLCHSVSLVCWRSLVLTVSNDFWRVALATRRGGGIAEGEKGICADDQGARLAFGRPTLPW